MKAIDKELFDAAKRGNCDLIKSLLSRGANPKANKSWALILATAGKFLDCMKVLLPLSDATEKDSYALSNAAAMGFVEGVKLLLPASNPLAGGSAALIISVTVVGNPECVKLLIPVSDPCASDSEALRKAVLNEHIDCVKLLIPVSDVNVARKRMISDGKSVLLLDSILQEKELKANFPFKDSLDRIGI